MSNKIIWISVLVVGLMGGGYVWIFSSPERCLKKKTQKIIALSSVKSSLSDMAFLHRVSKIAKFIHFDVHLKAEYEGKVYTAQSLNDFRSLLVSYFKYQSQEEITYKDLEVTMEEDKKGGLVHFNIFFKENSKHVSCKAFFEWVKDKKWQVKTIEIFSCSPVIS